jgi:BTB/POZ domain-containing protein 9
MTTYVINVYLFLFLGKLYNKSEYSDIELVIESEHFYAQRVILAARSEYFRALLYGGLRESQQDNHIIEIKECKAEAFKILLLYIYTGRINLIKEKVKKK